jgi:hypothetical protein
VGRRTVDRMLKSDVAATLDTIEAISSALDVSPWQLLQRSEASYTRKLVHAEQKSLADHIAKRNTSHADKRFRNK